MNKYKYKFVDVCENRLTQIKRYFLACIKNKDSAVLSCIFVCNRSGTVTSAPVPRCKDT